MAVTVLLLGLWIVQVYALETLQVSFNRTYVQVGRTEEVSGTLYYRARPERTVVRVEEPLKQWMVLEGGRLEIFYPEERRAFRILSKHPTNLPFFQAFLGALKEDYGLRKSGYALLGHEVRGDTLLTYWNPPKKLKKALGRFTLAYVGDKIIRAELRGLRGELLSRVLYGDHFPYAGAFLPLHIFTVRYTRSDTIYEEITYREPKCDFPLPEEVLQFRIPDDMEVEEVCW
ncbi:MAG TPA: hypothetical protein EYP17_09115 [Candidatus Latescibacteria bacterium]|nr:hypothetical protein [Candidatus Latescibacterota bacterium]